MTGRASRDSEGGSKRRSDRGRKPEAMAVRGNPRRRRTTPRRAREPMHRYRNRQNALCRPTPGEVAIATVTSRFAASAISGGAARWKPRGSTSVEQQAGNLERGRRALIGARQVAHGADAVGRERPWVDSDAKSPLVVRREEPEGGRNSGGDRAPGRPALEQRTDGRSKALKARLLPRRMAKRRGRCQRQEGNGGRKPVRLCVRGNP